MSALAVKPRALLLSQDSHGLLPVRLHHRMLPWIPVNPATFSAKPATPWPVLRQKAPWRYVWGTASFLRILAIAWGSATIAKHLIELDTSSHAAIGANRVPTSPLSALAMLRPCKRTAYKATHLNRRIVEGEAFGLIKPAPASRD